LITAIRTQLLEAITHCESKADFVSRELLEDLLEHTEGHFDWLETQLALVEKVGVQNYLQSNM
jgi:bacterioferritin